MKTQLKCPKCGKTFEYNFIPGASLTAIRLGNYRYMNCPLCGKVAMFNITKNLSHGQKRKLGVFSVIVGIILAVFGALLFARASSIHINALYFTGALLFAVALFTLISGIISFKK